MTKEEILERIMEPYSESANHITFAHISPEKLAGFLEELTKKLM